jgi:aminoglycoside/choline kinase family phosphotransferase
VQYLQSLHEDGSEAADLLYTKALDELLKIQKLSPQVLALPLYDEALLRREMALFRDWFCMQLLSLPLSAAEESMMGDTFDFLVASALAQPRVFVHRDYHSRNLMHCGDGPPGVLDFQDAVWGPATYDLVSLLKDCYIDWPRNKVIGWVSRYQKQAEASGVIPVLSTRAFLHDFDLMGVQRHLKAIGIFSRLKLRDGKTGYLKDIPRTLEYILVLEGMYPELDPFIRWCRKKIVPLLPEMLNVAGAHT